MSVVTTAVWKQAQHHVVPSQIDLHTNFFRDHPILLDNHEHNCGKFFPTCQVRVVRFYVSLFFSFFSFFSFFFSFSSSSLSSPPSSFSSINWDPLCSVWRAGPQWQLGSSQFSVACWTPNATGILSVQCGVLDPNRDLMSSVWRAGPQPRYCEFSVACWTPTAILRVECGVLDPNRDIACSVWRPGPQPRYCEFSVVAWTPTAIL